MDTSRIDLITQAGQQALNWNQNEEQKLKDLWFSQRIKYIPEYKSLGDFLPSQK